MKGVVFTEYLAFVELHHEYEMVDRILLELDLPSGGAYTSIGSYDHSELVQILMKHSELTNQSPNHLLKEFGKYLFHFFVKAYPVFFQGGGNSFDFLSSIEDKIHPQVLKLYPDAELPRFEISVQGNQLEMIYSSHRAMADFAEGLIEACFNFYQESAVIKRENLKEDGTRVRFIIIKS